MHNRGPRLRIGAPDECWPWLGALDGCGYAQLEVKGVKISAHRLVYTLFIGGIQTGMEIDHLCRVRHCMNPAHMEVVNHRTNSLRGTSPMAVNARKTYCVHGHDLAGANLIIRPDGSRHCRECGRAADRRYKTKQRGLALIAEHERRAKGEA